MVDRLLPQQKDECNDVEDRGEISPEQNQKITPKEVRGRARNVRQSLRIEQVCQSETVPN